MSFAPRPRLIERVSSVGRRASLPGALLLVAALVAGLVTPTAGAQDIDSLRQRAEELADELKELEVQASIADEQYLGTLEEIESVRAEIGTTETAVAEAQAWVDAVEAQAGEYLVTSYMEAGSTRALTVAEPSDMNRAVNQRVLLDTLRGDRLEIVEEISASRSDLQARRAELDDQQAELAGLEQQRKEDKERLESLVAQQQGLYDDASAELREAVAAEQRRREEEAARKAAEEMARAQAEAAAAAQRQAAAAAAAQQTRRISATAPAQTGSSTTAPPASADQSPQAPPASTPPAAPAIPPNSGAQGAIAAAKSQLGRPYRWGGTSPATGFDCSGLMLWSWQQVGVSLPRTSRAQYAGTQRVPISQLQPGDLVFSGNPVHHVGMYIGGGQMIHSPRTGDVVKITSISYMGGLTGGGRIR